jgi:hypothetical protein
MTLLLAACQRLEETPWSRALHESIWVYPIVESAHVLTLCVFVGLTVLMDLRLVGLLFRETPAEDVIHRLLPWIRAGFVAMAVTGALLFYSTPVRFYGNVFFRAKVVLLVLAGLNAALYHAGRSRPRWAGAASLLLWSSVIASGRLIAYNWFK